ncbi:hypothetical protein HOT74_gp74 [Microbacterium phage KaiHaiDragon]|uniref:Uncharacterized protein n=1 Tax=Microbacterium phage KaiHaiDragon TaxID=2992931 RepID=A0A345MI04_9CAUD|nr:hypothetical protein HOT74_gp74 [Microbacterium phage KaiHaiDragon]AXH70185.1 hypothetical protein SEA_KAIHAIDRAGON_73 [Microbacterium phage KaiHaiDragon]UVG34548.1 hypothetical protein EARICKHC_73 [Microbacterium phage EarickHC]
MDREAGMSALRDLIKAGIEKTDAAWTEDTTPTTLDGWITLLAEGVEKELVQATGGEGHLVRVKGREWVIQHPLTERFEPVGNGTALMDCRFTTLVGTAMAQRAMYDGTHRVWIDRGVLQWTEVGE